MRVSKIGRSAMVLLVLLVTLVSACGPKPPDPVKEVEKVVAKAKISAAMKAAYTEANIIYSQRVAAEKDMSAGYRNWMENFSKMMAGAGDQYALVQGCYKDAETVITAAAAAVFSTDADGNPVSPEQENQAFINALMTGGTLYAGDIDRCQDGALELMDYVRVERETSFGKREKFVDMMRSYDLSMVEDLQTATVLRFYNNYAPTIAALLEDGEGELLDAIGADQGLEPLPYDFIGFPTAMLQVQTQSEEVCGTFMTLYKGEGDYIDGVHRDMYLVKPNPLGGCSLHRLSAYLYMNRPFMIKRAADAVDKSEDTGLFPTPSE